MREITVMRLALTVVLLLGIGSVVKLNPAPHDAFGAAHVWLDVNGDGIDDPNEPPMADVCAWAFTTLKAYSSDEISQICDTAKFSSTSFTNKDGKWPPGKPDDRFFPGASCDDVYVYVDPPLGYKPTTPLIVNGCEGQFGITSISTNAVTVSAKYQEYVDALSTQKVMNEIKKYLPQVFALASIIVISFVLSVVLIQPRKVDSANTKSK